MKNDTLQTAYLLHAKPYRETSVIAQFFTRDYGKISAVVRGVRGPLVKTKKVLQPFTPLLISWFGKEDLHTLRELEVAGKPFFYEPKPLVCGLYLNELLSRLLVRPEPYPQLFESYREALASLQNAAQTESILRIFEKNLLMYLGYELSLDLDFTTGEAIIPEALYVYEPGHGVMLTSNQTRELRPVFKGHSLLALHQECLESPEVLRDAKQLLRQALHSLLGGKPIRSRELFAF